MDGIFYEKCMKFPYLANKLLQEDGSILPIMIAKEEVKIYLLIDKTLIF